MLVDKSTHLAIEIIVLFLNFIQCINACCIQVQFFYTQIYIYSISWTFIMVDSFKGIKGTIHCKIHKSLTQVHIKVGRT